MPPKLSIFIFAVGLAVLPSLAHAADQNSPVAPTILRVAVHSCGPDVSEASFAEMLSQCAYAEAGDGSPSIRMRIDGEWSSIPATGEFFETTILPEVSKNVTVMETKIPESAEFGTIGFAPDGENGGGESLISYGAGIVNLDASLDNDRLIELHIFNVSSAPDLPLTRPSEDAVPLSLSSENSGEDNEENVRERLVMTLSALAEEIAARLDSLMSGAN